MHKPSATYQVDGTAIRTRRKELGLSQKGCATQAGIARAYLSQLETGARDEMRPPTYRRLREVLEVPPDDARLLVSPEEHQRKDIPDADEGSPHPVHE